MELFGPEHKDLGFNSFGQCVAEHSGCPIERIRALVHAGGAVQLFSSETSINWEIERILANRVQSSQEPHLNRESCVVVRLLAEKMQK